MMKNLITSALSSAPLSASRICSTAQYEMELKFSISDTRLGHSLGAAARVHAVFISSTGRIRLNSAKSLVQSENATSRAEYERPPTARVGRIFEGSVGRGCGDLSCCRDLA